MNRKALTLTLPALALAALAAGCGGSDSAQSPAATGAATKQAAAATGDTRTCPKNSPSFTYTPTIRNLLDSPIMLNASQYDCNDWDGTSTPGRAFTGQVIQPGERRTFTLQPARNTTRNWTMEFVGTGGTPFYGRARLRIPTTTVQADSIKAVGAKDAVAPELNDYKVVTCAFLPMERTGAPATGWADLQPFFDVAITVVSRDGFITLATACGSPTAS